MESVEKKYSKAGRPIKTVKKIIRAAVRFEKNEYFIIKTKAEKAGYKVSAYIRQVAIKTEVKPRLSDEDRQIARKLAGISNNINQLSKTAHKEGMLSALRYFESFKTAIDEFLKKFCHA